MDKYKTAHTPLAAYLMGISPLETMRLLSDGRVQFVFQHSKEITDACEAFFSDTARVNPASYADMVRTLGKTGK